MTSRHLSGAVSEDRARLDKTVCYFFFLGPSTITI
jgi:hypothetical protein